MNNNIYLDHNIGNNLYNILELENNASRDEIKKSFKKLALKYHPDKNKDKDTKQKFIEIKYAYDILSNEELKKKYDINLNNIYKFNDFDYNILNNLSINIKNFIKTTDFDKLIKIFLKNKKMNPYNILKLYNYFNNKDEKITNEYLNINLNINFTLKEIWNGLSKNIKIHRDTKEIFEEEIYPLDLEQIYENEGEIIKINNKIYNGNLNIKINITEKIYNNEQYYVFQEELYIIINKNRIINNKFSIKYLDDNEYKFNVNKLKNITNELGNVCLKRNFGLDKFYINKNNKTIIHGNLFFIFVL